MDGWERGEVLEGWMEVVGGISREVQKAAVRQPCGVRPVRAMIPRKTDGSGTYCH